MQCKQIEQKFQFVCFILDLCDCECLKTSEELVGEVPEHMKVVNILMIGAGDCRNILKTIANRRRHKKRKIHVCLITFLRLNFVINICRLVFLFLAAFCFLPRSPLKLSSLAAFLENRHEMLFEGCNSQSEFYSVKTTEY